MARNLVTVSKYLAKHFRHEPDALGLTLLPGGWVSVDDLLAASERASISLPDEHWLFRRSLFLPLEKPIGQNQTSVVFEGLSERWLGSHGLGPGVNHAASDLRIVSPRGNQPPAK
jgi:RNA 2'-phosphotransferase, Tpt1 / KptA family